MWTPRLPRRDAVNLKMLFSASPRSGCSPAGWRVHRRRKNAPSTAEGRASDEHRWRLLTIRAVGVLVGGSGERRVVTENHGCVCVCLSIKLGIPVLKWGHLLVFTRLGWELDSAWSYGQGNCVSKSPHKDGITRMCVRVNQSNPLNRLETVARRPLLAAELCLSLTYYNVALSSSFFHLTKLLWISIKPTI